MLKTIIHEKAIILIYTKKKKNKKSSVKRLYIFLHIGEPTSIKGAIRAEKQRETPGCYACAKNNHSMNDKIKDN